MLIVAKVFHDRLTDYDGCLWDRAMVRWPRPKSTNSIGCERSMYALPPLYRRTTCPCPSNQFSQFPSLPLPFATFFHIELVPALSNSSLSPHSLSWATSSAHKQEGIDVGGLRSFSDRRRGAINKLAANGLFRPVDFHIHMFLFSYQCFILRPRNRI